MPTFRSGGFCPDCKIRFEHHELGADCERFRRVTKDWTQEKFDEWKLKWGTDR